MLWTSVKLLPSSLFTSLPIDQPTYLPVVRLVQGKTLVPFVQSYWAGLISRWVTILGSLCCMPWEVRLALCSTLAHPTPAILRGLSFSRSQPDLRVFLRVPRFSSLSKIDSQVKKHLAWVLCPGIIHDRLAAAIETPFTCIRPIQLSCALRNSDFRLQVRVISRHYYLAIHLPTHSLTYLLTYLLTCLHTYLITCSAH